MTESTAERTIIEILKTIYESNSPIGARLIADILNSKGYFIGERGVRYHLKNLDANGFTIRVGYSVRDGCIQGRSRSHPEPVEFLLVHFFILEILS